MNALEEKCAVARRLILELEARDRQTFALAMKALGEIEEDARELRREALKRDVEFFTEEQFAARVKVSAKSIAKLRKAGKLIPCNVGGPIRYSTAHVEQLSQIPITETGRRRERPHLQEVPQQDRRTG